MIHTPQGRALPGLPSVREYSSGDGPKAVDNQVLLGWWSCSGIGYAEVQRWVCSLGDWQHWMALLHNFSHILFLPGLGIKTKHAVSVTGKVSFSQGAYYDVLVAFLTRLPKFPSPILFLFFGDYFPMLYFLPALFLFFLVPFPCLL